ncbi:uncharacterized protein LOC133192226 [Saccostrea echinata]|uniref:uncharacterized protein LOC133192226 n=1 Tax=Saccostrea echinata TaxID=191078 RepID=UPI002A7FE887|nr:uncharacterized protein LOC133192226 [Saccostrea echinata]
MSSNLHTEQIRNLEDLVQRVSKDLSLSQDCKRKAQEQYKILKSNGAPRLKEAYKELEDVVKKAENYDIAGFREARVEFESLLQNRLGQEQQEGPKTFAQTLPLGHSAQKQEFSKTFKGPVSTKSADDNHQKRSSSPARADGTITVSALEYKRLVESEKMNKAKVEELTTRLSSYVSKQLKDGNPNIADLSDKNRPTKLGEKFEQLYDNEWSDAYEILKSTIKDEDKVVKTLVDITQKVHEFCCNFAPQQIERLESYFMNPMQDIKCKDYVLHVHRNSEDNTAFFELSKYMKDCRKSCATASIPALQVMFKDFIYKEHFPNKKPEIPLEIFIDKCVEFIWLMSVQDPPMDLRYPIMGEKFDTSSFKHFRKKGTIVQQCVWPAVYLHKDGPVVSKGFALPQ